MMHSNIKPYLDKRNEEREQARKDQMVFNSIMCSLLACAVLYGLLAKFY
jgi:hypothetical protein